VIAPGAQITLSSSAVSPSETNPTYTYSWSSVPPGFTSSTQNPVLNPTTTTTYVVTITNSALGCSDTASITVNVGTTGINIQEKITTFNLYPNPSTGIIHIESDVPAGKEFEICVYDVIGNLLLKEKNTKEIDMSSFHNGMYNIVLTSEDAGTIVRKLSLIK
jgi:hypothetical protein